MVSFDVSNLFTSIPREETIPLVSKLLGSNKLLDFEKDDILDLLQFCLNQDFFQFNNKFYKQPIGLAMGSPLSPFLADLFMNNLELKFVNKHKNIIFWTRYVDDCFALIEGSEETANSILNDLNKLHPNITFTLETEINKQINFLDLTISRSENSLDFGIFRKPTQTDHVINFHSNHPWTHKMAAFHSFINRLLKVPLSIDNFNKELNIIKQIAVNNGYQVSIVTKLLNRTKNKIQTKLAFNPSLTLQNINNSDLTSKYFSLPYFGPLSNKISKFFSSLTNKNSNVINRHTNILSFKPLHNIGSMLVNTKDKRTNHLQKSGIYKLNCGDCSASYVGRTIRPLHTRLKEHFNASKKSSFKDHLNFNNHSFNEFNNSVILHEYNTNYSLDLKLSLLEDLEISRELKNNPNNCNKQVDLNCNSFNPIFKSFNLERSNLVNIVSEQDP